MYLVTVLEGENLDGEVDGRTSTVGRGLTKGTLFEGFVLLLVSGNILSVKGVCLGQGDNGRQKSPTGHVEEIDGLRLLMLTSIQKGNFCGGCRKGRKV